MLINLTGHPVTLKANPGAAITLPPDHPAAWVEYATDPSLDGDRQQADRT